MPCLNRKGWIITQTKIVKSKTGSPRWRSIRSVNAIIIDDVVLSIVVTIKTGSVTFFVSFVLFYFVCKV